MCANEHLALALQAEELVLRHQSVQLAPSGHVRAADDCIACEEINPCGRHFHALSTQAADAADAAATKPRPQSAMAS